LRAQALRPPQDGAFEFREKAHMVKSVAMIVAAALALLLAACGRDGGTSDLKANVRFVHVSPGTDAVNISYDSTTVVTALAYHGASAYQPLDFGSHEIKVQSTAAGAVYSDVTVSPTFNGFHTYLLYGGESSMQTQLLTDTVADAASGKFNLRAVNVATGIGTVDVYLLPVGSTIAQAAPTFSSLAYGQNSGFTQFSTGDYNLLVTRTGTKDTIYDSGKQTIATNTKVTLLAYATGSGKLVNGALLYTDSTGTTTFVDSSQARFKFVNAATDHGSVDVLVDGLAALANVPHGLLSAYSAIAAGNRNFKIQSSSAPGAYLYDQNKMLARRPTIRSSPTACKARAARASSPSRTTTCLPPRAGRSSGSSTPLRIRRHTMPM
jgi:hypothetical protein